VGASCVFDNARDGGTYTRRRARTNSAGSKLIPEGAVRDAHSPMPRQRRGSREPVPRKSPRDGRAKETVDAIVTAAERVLEKHGSRGLTTNRVAEVAGVSIGSVYQYYPNKEALVAALSDRYVERTMRFARQGLIASRSVPATAFIDVMVQAMMALHESQRPINRWLVELRTAAAFHERVQREFDVFAGELADELAARNDVRFANPHAAAFVLVHMFNGIMEAVSMREHADIPGIVDEVRRVLAAYAAAHPAP
jgi:AcrR family transcriptional regulator